MLDIEKNCINMDEELFELRQHYMDMKKDAKKAEKDSGLLENKLKLLQSEEVKVKFYSLLINKGLEAVRKK